MIKHLLQELHSRTFLYNKIRQNSCNKLDGSRVSMLPEDRGEEDLPAVYLIQHTQILFVGDFVRMRFVFERFHVIVKIEFTSFID